MVRRALITGATGFIGSEFLRRLVTWDPDVEPILLVRDTRRQRAAERVAALGRELFGSDGAAALRRAHIVVGDLLSDRLGLDDETYDDLAATVSEIWNFGADVRFDQPLETARQVHIEGSLQLAALAGQAARDGQFTRFHQVSTYATARRDDIARFAELPPVLTSHYRNSYEQSKAEAEVALLALAEALPLTIHRVGIVIGDSTTGWTAKFDVFYLPIRLLLDEMDADFARLRIPVLESARVNAVAIDDVANTLFVLGRRQRGPSGEILHLLPGPSAPLVAGTMAAAMREFIAARARRGLKPVALPTILALDDVSMGNLAEVLGDEVPPEVLEMVMQVMPYGFDSAIWENDRLVAALAGSGVACRPIDSFLGPIVDYPVRSGWGTIAEPRPPIGPAPV